MQQTQSHRPLSNSFFSLCGSALAVLSLAACTTRTPAPIVEGPLSSRTPVTTAPKPVTPEVTPQPGSTYGSKFHVVQRGETLYRIALNNRLDVNSLMAWNEMAPGQVLRDGQVLRLEPPTAPGTAAVAAGTGVTPAEPSTSGATVTGTGATTSLLGQPLPGEPAAGLTPIPTPVPLDGGTASPLPPPSNAPLLTEPRAQRLTYSDAALATLQGAPAANAAVTPMTADNAITPPVTPPPTNTATVTPDVKPGDGVEKEGVSWTWPTTGKVASSFNEKAAMKGIDIATNAAAPVVAAARGKVIYIGKEPRGYGQMVVINHANQTVSVYFHTDKVLVKEQQQVTLGQKIAEVAAGTAGSKMHFEVRRQGRPLDPLSVLPQR